MARATAGLTTKAPFKLNPKDDEGNVKPLENFSVESESGDVQYEYDEATGEGFVYSDTIGVTPFRFKADARPGSEESFIYEDHEMEVLESEATSFGTTFGAAVPR